MPKRAAPGDREKLEAALSETLRAALEELRVSLDVDDWQQTPLGPPFQAAAATRRAAMLHQAGVAPGEALHAAADQLGLNRETVRGWLRRWGPDSRHVHNERAARRASPASLVEHEADTLPTKDEAA